MNTYTLKVEGGADCHINPKGARYVELKIDDKKATVNINDLAMVVKECLPVEEADELFSHVDEKQIQSGKVKVKIRANKDIKKDDYVIFNFDITKYLDKQGNPTGIRSTRWGFIY